MQAAKKLIEEKPDIFNYHDYRAYLKDWLQFVKTNHSFSLRQVANDSGLSVSFLSMVVSGTRKLSDVALEKLLPILEMDERQSSYFSLLRTVGDSESHNERVQALGKLQKFNSYKKMNQKELEAYRYLSHWYYVAISAAMLRTRVRNRRTEQERRVSR